MCRTIGDENLTPVDGGAAGLLTRAGLDGGTGWGCGAGGGVGWRAGWALDAGAGCVGADNTPTVPPTAAVRRTCTSRARTPMATAPPATSTKSTAAAQDVGTRLAGAGGGGADLLGLGGAVGGFAAGVVPAGFGAGAPCWPAASGVLPSGMSPGVAICMAAAG